MDATGGLWMKGALVGKSCGVFQSTGTQGGGQETIALTGIVPFATHHGMVFVPIGGEHPYCSYWNGFGGIPPGSSDWIQ